ncbi:hypothetical protein OVN20_04425 [Microcella daejeonensis]|uniref:hypothetical protein n=1 Tax=Microcella daejeonensis TaxID=2994971 RepID=UPI002271E1EE|nr:hypothetical protein [Microcella daejeonensis]WAB84818.1 hypothetical protein OVN20_04425 [Microcella daejeonensis]
MSGYELSYDAGCWYRLPDSGDARGFADEVVADLRASRPDLDADDAHAVRGVAEAVVLSRPDDASESFLFLPADVGALGVAHLSIIVPAAGEIYSAVDVMAAADDALLPPARSDLEFASLGRGSRIITVTPGETGCRLRASSTSSRTVRPCSWSLPWPDRCATPAS